MSKKRKGPSKPRTQPVPQGITLSASLIVKDEAGRMAACLGALDGLVDEVVVFDTGSTDDTAEIAESLGARVFRGEWPGDFASARNLALAECTGTWVLSVDADEIVEADPRKLRALLARTSSSCYAVLIHNIVAQGGAHDFDHRGGRLFRRRGSRWAGGVHELPADESGRPLPSPQLPAEVLSIMHYGYADQHAVAEKCERNAEIVRTEMRRLASLPEPPAADHVGRMLANLMRSEEGRNDPQSALVVGAVLAEMLPGDQAWAQGVDRLAHVALSFGTPRSALPFVRRLRDSGKAPGWAQYLEGETLRRMGRYDEAWRLMEPLRPGLVNTIGVVLPDPMLHGAKALAALQAGVIAVAAEELTMSAVNADPGNVASALAADPTITDARLAQLADALSPRDPALAEAVRTCRTAGAVGRSPAPTVV